MHIQITREELLKPLSHVVAVIERRQALPILANVAMSVKADVLQLTGTDLEIELVATTATKVMSEGAMTVPARKLYDICRALPVEATVELRQEGDKASVKSGKSRFTLLTLPAGDFPSIEGGSWGVELRLPQQNLKQVVDRTHFCMAHQDVRYYLNGLLLELSGKRLRAVATDGHRMGLSEVELLEAVGVERQVIVPRKGVLEIARFLDASEDLATLSLSANHIRISVQDLTLTSKLIDGRFPDYQQVLPVNYKRVVRVERAPLREALTRAAILANEKYRGVRVTVRPGVLLITAHNPEQEQAQEELSINYEGEEVEVGFNVNYVMEALGGLDSEEVELGINDAHSSCAVLAPGRTDTRYVVMPMRL
jgi:DNA polymerase III subunit beta